MVWLLVGRLKAGAQVALAPGVLPVDWLTWLMGFSIWLVAVSFGALVSSGPPAALLGAAGAGVALGLRRLGAGSVIGALACTLLGAIAGVLCVLVPLAATSLGLGLQEALARSRRAGLDPGDPYAMAGAVTGMVFGLVIWLVVGRLRAR